MFGKLFGKKPLVISAPINGQAVALSDVSDPTFSQELLGKGAAIKPSAGRIVAPADGTVGMMFDTGHAVSLTTKDGVEVLIHVGIDTVNLKGEHFTAHCTSGDEVKKGQLLIEFDLDAVAAAGYDTIVPVIICNTPDYKDVEGLTGTVSAGDPLVNITK